MSDNPTRVDARPQPRSIFAPCLYCHIPPVQSSRKLYARCGFCNNQEKPLKITWAPRVPHTCLERAPRAPHTCLELIVVHSYLLLHAKDPTVGQITFTLGKGASTITFTYCQGYLYPATGASVPEEVPHNPIPIRRYDLHDHRVRGASREIIERIRQHMAEGYRYPMQAGQHPRWRRRP